MGFVNVRMTATDLAGLVDELVLSRTLCEKAGATATAARVGYYVDLLTSPMHVTADGTRPAP